MREHVALASTHLGLLHPRKDLCYEATAPTRIPDRPLGLILKI